MFSGGIKPQPVDNARTAEELSRIRVPTRAPTTPNAPVYDKKPAQKGDHVARNVPPAAPAAPKFQARGSILTRGIARLGNNTSTNGSKIVSSHYNGVKTARLSDGRTRTVHEFTVRTQSGDTYIIQGDRSGPDRFKRQGASRWSSIIRQPRYIVTKIRNMFHGSARRANAIINDVYSSASRAKSVGRTRVFINGLSTASDCYRIGSGSNTRYVAFAKRGGNTYMLIGTRRSSRTLKGITHSVNLSKYPLNIGRRLIAMANRRRAGFSAVAGSSRTRTLMSTRERVSSAYVSHNLSRRGNTIRVTRYKARYIKLADLSRGDALPLRVSGVMRLREVEAVTSRGIKYQIHAINGHIIRYRAVAPNGTVGEWINCRSASSRVRPPAFITRAYSAGRGRSSL